MNWREAHMNIAVVAFVCFVLGMLTHAVLM